MKGKNENVMYLTLSFSKAISVSYSLLQWSGNLQAPYIENLKQKEEL